MHSPLRSAFALFALALSSSPAAPKPPASVVSGGGFEKKSEDWSLFVPESSKDASPTFEIVSGGARSGSRHLRLQSSAAARFAYVHRTFSVAPGTRYRVSVWVRCAPGLEYSTGPLLRVIFREASPSAVETAYYINTAGAVFVGESPRLPRPATLPEKWTKLEAVIEVPEGAVTAGSALFAWGTRGAVDFDDFSMELVSPTTPVTTFRSAEDDAAKTIPPVSAARVGEIASFLSAKPDNVCPPWSDRAYWERAAALPSAARILEKAKALIGTEPPVLTEELFNDYSISGLRRPYELPNGDRTNRLFTLVLAECMAPDDARLAQIVREVNGVMDEPTWVVPAHAKKFRTWHEARRFIDLPASARGWTLANLDFLLADRLPRATRDRIRFEVGDRVLKPWIERIRAGTTGELWWMRAKMNWSAVCNSGVLGSALLLLDDPRERAEYIAAWELLNPDFLSGFTSDGYCAEGIGYWGYGFGHFVMAAQLVHRVTGGNVDPLATDQVRRIMAYGPGMEIDSQIYPAFSDVTLGTKADIYMLEFAAARFGLGKVRGLPAFRGESILGGRIHVALFDLAMDRASAGQAASNALPLRTFFPVGGALISRSPEPGRGMSIAIKGGHNNEPHNQNDLGSFSVVVDGKLALTDLGKDDYVKETFGPLRYTSGVMNSFGHSVPRVAGVLQRTGAEARAVTVRTEFTPERDTWEMDLTSAYPAPALQKLTRTFIFNRADGGSLEILDQATFSSPQAFDVGFSLLPRQRWVEKGADGHLVEGGDGGIRVAITAEDGAALVRTEEPIIGILAGAAPKGLRVGFAIARPASSVRIRTLITPASALP